MNPKSIPKQHKSMAKVWREENIEERELRKHLSDAEHERGSAESWSHGRVTDPGAKVSTYHRGDTRLREDLKLSTNCAGTWLNSLYESRLQKAT